MSTMPAKIRKLRSRSELDAMLALANKGIKELIVGQKRAIAALG